MSVVFYSQTFSYGGVVIFVEGIRGLGVVVCSGQKSVLVSTVDSLCINGALQAHTNQ